ncbi:hypothetical protein JKP88DRAFT_347644 [Tribonema minus]|uniref:Uncharacterized protein n=1 Tax=Tribonema minus TaxID=303371 RepID=A0A836CNB6_9STRA|nr:hypothetical protein JKP88DRAFT_347644 [Tribonema minus]
MEDLDQHIAKRCRSSYDGASDGSSTSSSGTGGGSTSNGGSSSGGSASRRDCSSRSRETGVALEDTVEADAAVLEWLTSMSGDDGMLKRMAGLCDSSLRKTVVEAYTMMLVNRERTRAAEQAAAQAAAEWEVFQNTSEELAEGPHAQV